MGNCLKSKASDKLVCYEKSVIIFIKQDDSLDKFLPTEKIKLKLTDPIRELSENFIIGTYKMHATGCAVPGQDPRGNSLKICQDHFFISNKPDYLFITLYDGHGSKGEDIVKYTHKYMEEKFLVENFHRRDCEMFLKEMFESCDIALKSQGKSINVYGSGTTAVSILFCCDGIFVASVGDSRAILSTIPDEQYIPVNQNKNSQFNKRFTPLRVLEPIQLTTDQKPNIESEFNRIIAAGGVVEKSKDETGEEYGPYRVFHKGKNIPGLAMSRSLGDMAAKKVGVISTPIIDFYPLVPFKDQFIVIASDGIWDTMENYEVTDFVETFRKKCLPEPQIIETQGNLVETRNSTIARLLVEEARYRWLMVCCNENTIIDDISAVVIEINTQELAANESDEISCSRISKYTSSCNDFNTSSKSIKHATARDTIISSYGLDDSSSDEEIINQY
ncbi:hypothetical protein SteCoe_12664 [Stentor coeruleus]|uniref:PPM-type phosphatase domain-containing protein n=1 Tax=Stentor coeruleus TaxID=5963 RepID=A0A1R2CA98_9CILI|nr:hypothetical protein SteCoe_12664 [Stentor coeruleus]